MHKETTDRADTRTASQQRENQNSKTEREKRFREKNKTYLEQHTLKASRLFRLRASFHYRHALLSDELDLWVI